MRNSGRIYPPKRRGWAPFVSISPGRTAGPSTSLGTTMGDYFGALRCRALLGWADEGVCPYVVSVGRGARLQRREFVLTFFCFFLFGGEAAFQKSSGQVLTAYAEGDGQS
jgi:hypothetical protein